MIKLNLGCGTDIRKGYINADILDLPGTNINFDMDIGIPFPDNYFDEVYTEATLDYSRDIVKLMKEIHRVLKPKGLLRVSVPYYNSERAFIDPLQHNRFTYKTFDCFTKDTAPWIYGIEFKIVRKELLYGKFGRIFPKFLRYHVSLILKEVAYGLEVDMKKVKD